MEQCLSHDSAVSTVTMLHAAQLSNYDSICRTEKTFPPFHSTPD